MASPRSAPSGDMATTTPAPALSLDEPARSPVVEAAAVHQNASGSESSENGVRMTAAEARRFARRNLRRASATPDLVTSLVRPPSPEAFYITPEVHDRMRMGAYRRVRGNGSARSAPAETRTGPLLPPHDCSLELPDKHGGRAVFDFYALDYVTEPDSNLCCPICHDVLVDPITTPCDHTFCYRCIRRSMVSSPSGAACPIDREALSWSECFTTARLIRTQLNSLLVRCPFTDRGCTMELRREVAEKHSKDECRFREFYCPDKDCTKKLPSKPKDETCRHHEISCSLCSSKMEATEVDKHLLSCPRSKTRCLGCWEMVVRDELPSHEEVECSGVEVGCTYQDLGCPVRVLRGQVRQHTPYCAFHPETPSGIVIRTQRDLIKSYNDLGTQIRDLANRQVENNKSIEELRSLLSTQSALGDGAGSVQHLDSGLEEVHKNLTHLETRQSMYTLSQVMPIREEVTELRNNINMVRMHVNWLLSRSREEGRMRAANTTGVAAAIRRDSAGDGPPMMPERRRSSSADIDIPRL